MGMHGSCRSDSTCPVIAGYLYCLHSSFGRQQASCSQCWWLWFHCCAQTEGCVQITFSATPLQLPLPAGMSRHHERHPWKCRGTELLPPCWFAKGTVSSKKSLLIQKAPLYNENPNSDLPGDSKHLFLHCRYGLGLSIHFSNRSPCLACLWRELTWKPCSLLLFTLSALIDKLVPSLRCWGQK